MARTPTLHGDLSARAVAHSTAMPWVASPSASVQRKRLHRTGGEEDGQVTSVVRYAAGAKFPAHDHPEGEEILVLDGIFSDEHGDWPAGTFLANPEGFRHAPFSREGCMLFVKLRQLAGTERVHVALQTHSMDWSATSTPGIARKTLLDEASSPDETHLERWSMDASPGRRTYPGGAELFVVEGMFSDEADTYETHSWVRLPPGATHHPRPARECVVYIKTGGVAGLRAG